MMNNLKINGIDPTTIPVVIQFNKRDMPGTRPDSEIDEVAKKGKEPVFKASAISGKGVMDTFEGILRLTWRTLDDLYELEEKLQVKEEEFIKNLLRKDTLRPISNPRLDTEGHR